MNHCSLHLRSHVHHSVAHVSAPHVGGETAEPSQQAAGKASLKPARSPLGVRIKGTLRDIETLSIRSLFKRTRNRVKGPLVFLILTTQDPVRSFRALRGRSDKPSKPWIAQPWIPPKTPTT